MLDFLPITLYDYLTNHHGWQQLSKQGRNIAGPCPIHRGDHANFVIYPYDEHFHCYNSACNKNGDIVRLVKELEFPFLDENYRTWGPVYKRVRELSGQPLSATTTRRKEAVPRVREEHEAATPDQRRMMTLAFGWWHSCLHTVVGVHGWNWLETAGIHPYETHMCFPQVIGFAPEMTANLACQFARSMEKHFGDTWETLARETGILLKEGKHRNQNRVMFGCLDPEAREIVFYQGRTILESTPDAKYKRAKYLGPPSIRKAPFWVPLTRPQRINGTVVVESPKGPATLAQYGIRGVATLGSGVFRGMLGVLEYPLYIATDNDAPSINTHTGEVQPGAGEKLAERLALLCQQEHIPYYRITPPREYKDVDSWVREEGIAPLLREITKCGEFTPETTRKSDQNMVHLLV